MSSKIAVIGEVNGRISEVFEKLAKLHAKQSFAFAIVAGNLFAGSSAASDEGQEDITKLLEGTIEIPLPTYFALGDRPFPAEVIEKLSRDGEVCPNLTALGRKECIKTPDGFKLISIGGRYDGSVEDGMVGTPGTYSDRDVESAKDFKDADLLITSDWPANVTTGSQAPYPEAASPKGVESLGSLCTALRPRYHFSTSEKYFEREPFFHHTAPPRPVTRFISLAPYGNTEKQKWIYAFTLGPSAPPPTELTGCTATPFYVAKKRKAESQYPDDNGYGNHGHERPSYHNDRYDSNRGHHQGKRPRHPPPTTPRECYFCLANPACETHMIGSIGTDVYLTIAKGPLPLRDTFPGLGFPCHMLIIPLPHAPTITSIREDDGSDGSKQGTRKATHAEMLRYKEALQTMVSAKSTGADGVAKLGAVTWEISRAGGVHLHWQFLPLPAAMIEDGRVEAGFEVEAENLSYPTFTKKEADIAEAEQGDYFKVMLWTEEKQKEIVLPLNDANFRFDLQFGRRVLGKLLGLEKRTFWRDCEQTKEEEGVDAEAFKRAFKTYDFSLEK